jgi:uncharacterized low-complexity protein
LERIACLEARIRVVVDKNWSYPMSKSSLKPMVTALGAAFLASAVVPVASAGVINNPFAADALESGYDLANYDKHMEGKCGEGKCGGDKAEKATKEGKCGEGKCGGDKAEKATKEGKCGEGKCGGDKADKAAKEGKCGEGKCGGSN